MNHDEFLSKTIEFVSSKAGINGNKLNGETHLVGSGIVDSLLLTELILFVEDTLKCTIEIDNFRLATFESINSIYSSYGQ